MNIHEINVSEIIAGNEFTKVEDGFKLYKEVSRLISINDTVLVDFLGINKLGNAALINSIRRLREELDVDVFINIKYMNLSLSERSQIDKFINR